MGLSTFAFDILPERMRRKAAWKLLRRTSRIMRAYQTAEFVEQVGDTVQAGPFAGMVLPSDLDGADYQRDLLTMLLGVFEQELAGAVERLIAAAPRLVVNVGVAEGYYAVGLGRALPDARIVGYELLESARASCRRVAELNRIAIDLRGECTVAELNDVLDGPAALFVDCEGGERDLLDPAAVPALNRCDILVECHDMIVPGLTELMVERFRPTHRIERIDEGTRPLVAHPMLHNRTSLERLLAICEFRGGASNWLMMTAEPARSSNA